MNGSRVEWSADLASKSGDSPCPAEGDEVDVKVDARFEANGGSGGNIESVTVSGAAIEDEGVVCFSKMKVRADLDGAVAGVLHAVSYTHLTLPTNREV